MAALDIAGACGLIVAVTVLVPEPSAFVADTVIEKVPAAVGVPEMSPLVVLIVKPDGRPVAE